MNYPALSCGRTLWTSCPTPSRRSINSSNIAEGQGRLSAGEFRQFLSNALGSAREVERQVLIAVRLGYAATSDCEPLLGLVGNTARLISRLASANLSNHGDYVRARKHG